jgi:thiamine pyrophosphate-dependent acetolactate synthase large subunit-like protein
MDSRLGRHFGVDFGNPNLVTCAHSFGMRAYRIERADAEFAIVLSDDWQARGLGSRLLASPIVQRRTMACDGWSVRPCRRTTGCWRSR